MNVDPQALQSALEKYAIRADLTRNTEKIPYGVLLRGAYRAAKGGPYKEEFHSQRARETLGEACRLINSGSGEADVDVANIGRLIMLSEDQEYEDMAAHYMQLVDELPPRQRTEILDSTDGSTFGVSFSRTDWLSMARDEPQIALYFFVRACKKLESSRGSHLI